MKVEPRATPDVAGRLLRRIVCGLDEWSDKPPVQALVSRSHDADLVVVGSRGVTALGSVSERVAHRADATVLVVRPPESAP